MTTLKESMDTDKLNNQLLNLTNDLNGVLGLRALSSTAAEIWVTGGSTKNEVLARAEEHEELADVDFTFREEVDEAYSPGGATDRPRTWEPKNDDRDNDTDPFEELLERDPSSPRTVDE